MQKINGKRIIFILDESNFEKLEKLRKIRKTTRSATIRTLISESLDNLQKRLPLLSKAT